MNFIICGNCTVCTILIEIKSVEYCIQRFLSRSFIDGFSHRHKLCHLLIFSERLHKIIQEWSSTMCRHFMSDVYWFILEYDILFRHKVGKSKRLLENWNRIGKFLKKWFDINIFLETLMSAVLQRLFLLVFYYCLWLLSCVPPLPGLVSDWAMQSQCCGSIPVCVLYTVSASTTLCLHSLMSVCRLN